VWCRPKICGWTWPPQSTLATVERLAHLTRSYLHAALLLADTEEAEDVDGRQPPSAAEEVFSASDRSTLELDVRRRRQAIGSSRQRPFVRAA